MAILIDFFRDIRFKLRKRMFRALRDVCQGGRLSVKVGLPCLTGDLCQGGRKDRPLVSQISIRTMLVRSSGRKDRLVSITPTGGGGRVSIAGDDRADTIDC